MSSSSAASRGGARPLEPRPGSAWRRTSSRSSRARASRRGPARLLDRLVEHALRVLDPAGVEQRDAERREDLGARGVALRGQRDRALEQGRAGRRVAAPQRAPGGAREPLHRLGDERLLAREAELGAVGAGALEVVADDLVLGVGRALQPAGQPLVEVRAAALGQAAVGDLAEQRVGEAEAVVARRERSGWISWRRTSAVSGAVRSSSPSAASAPRRKLLPSTAACSSSVRSSAPSWSSRAASTASTVGGSSPSARSPPAARGRAGCRRRARPSGGAASPWAPSRATSASASISSSASRPSTAALRCGAAHDGRRSSSSGRPRQTSRIAAPLENAIR